MSLDYMLFLRDQPILEDHVEDFPELRRDGDGWVFYAMRLHVEAYRDDEVLEDSPWRDEIRWIVGASGRHDDDSWDDWESLMAVLGTRYRGGLWGDVDDELRWYWWDRDALAAMVRAFIDSNELRELTAWLARARGERGTRPLLGDPDGPREQVAQIVIEQLHLLRTSKAKNLLVLELWEQRDDLDNELRERLGDMLLELKGVELVETQEALRVERETQEVARVLLPTTLEELAALYDRASTDTAARRILQRGIDYFDGDKFCKTQFGAVLLERARAGASHPHWVTVAWPQIDQARERATPASRAAFAALGGLAKAIVKHWAEADEYAAKVDDMLERRRRGGEILAGIPDDIRALAAAGKHDEAYAEYARRYDLPLDKAKRVVDANS